MRKSHIHVGATAARKTAKYLGTWRINMADSEGKKKKPIGKIILGVVIAFLAIGVIGTMTGNGSAGDGNSDNSAAVSDDKEAKEQPKQEEQKQDPYTITEEAADTSSSFDYAITGILTNNSGRDADYVQVTYNLFDADNNQIGTAMANTSNLKAGGTWKFKASSLKNPSEVARFELGDVTGF